MSTDLSISDSLIVSGHMDGQVRVCNPNSAKSEMQSVEVHSDLVTSV